MKRELTPNEIKFDISIDKNIEKSNNVSEYEEAFAKIKRALKITKEGYNLYLVDSFSKKKLKELINFIEDEYKELEPPKDICYVTLEDENKPEAIFVANGKGKKLKETVSNIKKSYLDVIDDFYSDSTNDEKDFLVEEVENKRNDYLNELIKMAKDEGFEVKATSKGFAFLPLNNEEETMTEKEYDNLEDNHKDIIVSKAGNLKKRAETILEELRDIELKSIRRLKKLYTKFLSNKMEELKDDALLEFITDDDSYEYLERLFTCIEEDIVECYTMSIEDDENEIYRILNKYDVKVIVDNSNNFVPPVIYEEDPNLNNLIGTVEYENHNGMYVTNISLISAGAVLKANEGCLILRLNSLIMNSLSYYYLKKILLSNKVTIDSNKNLVEFININGLKPKPIPIKVKVILIGDYDSYDILYNSDEDFRKLFPLRTEIPDIVEITEGSINTLKDRINQKVKQEEILKINEDAVSEIIKYLCRKASSRENILIEDYTLDKLLQLTDIYVKEKGDYVITKEDVMKIAYEEEFIEKEFIKMYKKGKQEEILKINEDAVSEIIKYLCRKASSRENILIEDYTLDKLLQLTDIYVKEKGDYVITKEDVMKIAYEEEFIEKEFIKMYKKGKILITLTGEKVGSVNGLAVLDTGYYSFGRPIRITCVAYRGTGRIVDIQKESNLSGKIHEKSISILRGLLSSLLNAYESIPVDFHVSFEQTYGIVDGDSASIAEIITLLSALSKYKVKQNIAVTGSVNQFGEVQAIGGVSEKIEGFYKVCKIMDTIENKGVLIPASNRDELIILPEVEEAIINNKFHIYTMENLNDAIEVLMLDEGQTLEMFYEDIKKELKKYSAK